MSGQIVSLVVMETKTDLEIVRRREVKWLEMMSSWDSYMMRLVFSVMITVSTLSLCLSGTTRRCGRGAGRESHQAAGPEPGCTCVGRNTRWTTLTTGDDSLTDCQPVLRSDGASLNIFLYSGKPGEVCWQPGETLNTQRTLRR